MPCYNSSAPPPHPHPQPLFISNPPPLPYGEKTDRHTDWAEHQNDQKTKTNWELKCPKSLNLLFPVNRGTITPRCCVCCISFCNSHPFPCGVDLQEIGISPVPEPAKNSGLKKEKKKNLLSFCINSMNKFKNISVFQGRISLSESRVLAAEQS